MKVWRVSVRGHGDEHLMYKFFPAKKKATGFVRETMEMGQHFACEITKHEIQCTKLGVIRALNILADHPDNG